MRVLADENVHGAVVRALREAGHDVQWILEDSPGLDDHEVLARAVASQRVLITFDKADFGSIVFHKQHAAPPILLFRVSAGNPADLVRKVLTTLQTRDDWGHHFWTISDMTIRRRPLP